MGIILGIEIRYVKCGIGHAGPPPRSISVKSSNLPGAMGDSLRSNKLCTKTIPDCISKSWHASRSSEGAQAGGGDRSWSHCCGCQRTLAMTKSALLTFPPSRSLFLPIRSAELAVQLRRKGFLLPLTSNATHFQKILVRLVISRGGDSSGSYRPAAKMAKIAKFFRNGGGDRSWTGVRRTWKLIHYECSFCFIF